MQDDVTTTSPVSVICTTLPHGPNRTLPGPTVMVPVPVILPRKSLAVDVEAVNISAELLAKVTLVTGALPLPLPLSMKTSVPALTVVGPV